MKWAIGAVVIAAAVAGCGGSHPSDKAAIRAALAASTGTYLHYGERDWGRNPHVRVSIRIAGDLATAVLSPTGATPQQIRLSRNNGKWSVELVGAAVIKGPLESRPATKSELAAISAVAESRFPQAKGCVTYAAEVSTVNPRYARVDYVYPQSQLAHPHGQCGPVVRYSMDIYVHAASGWSHLLSGTTFYCSDAPPGVLRGLVGSCGLR